jgi:uncharacterized caspase-like protein
MRFVLALVVMLACAGEAWALRVALVIGNGAYEEAPALANPAADARGVAAALDRLGFATDLVIDADRAGMEAAIRRFGEAAAGAEAALVFYAGHAVEVGGRNYLIPVTARIRSDRDLPFETVDFDAVMTQLEGRARVILVFLDACRDNPFRQRLMAGGTRGIAAPGLAPVRGTVGTLVAFATAPGQVASDGHGQNSPFTAALLQHIETPGLEVRPMLGRVRQSVREATAGSQVPWENSSLEGEFYFRAAGGGQALAALAPAEQPQGGQGAPRSGISPDGATERLFWESVKDTRDPDELWAYLRRYPDGIFAELARARIGALERGPAPPVAPRASEAVPAAAVPAARPPPAAAPAAAPAASPAVQPPLVRPTAPPPAPPPPAAPPQAAPQVAPAQPQRLAVVRPPPPPPPSPPPAQQGFPGRGETIRVLTRLVPLPPGPWREAARWVEHAHPSLANGMWQIFSVHTVILVQEREGRPVAAIRVLATENDGSITGWTTPPPCRAEGSAARGLVSTSGLFVDCWSVRQGEVRQGYFARHLPEGRIVSSLHAFGDSRNMMLVEYGFTAMSAESLAAWAPGAQEAIRRGYHGQSGAAGLVSP